MRTSLFLPSLLVLSCVAAFPHAVQSQGFTRTSTSSTAVPIATAASANISDTVLPQRSQPEAKFPNDKRISTEVKDGVLVVDGLVAKVHLNYRIHHADYLYFFVPGVGTAVVARTAMPGAVKVDDAFHGSGLSFAVAGHSFDLTNSHALLGSGKAAAYVRLDTSAVALDRYPMMGFGSTGAAPYAWPLARAEAPDTSARLVEPPPLPRSILPRTKQ